VPPSSFRGGWKVTNVNFENKYDITDLYVWTTGVATSDTGYHSGVSGTEETDRGYV
jgi:hypothetical protein